MANDYYKGTVGCAVEPIVNTTAAKVKKAAETCPDAKRVLKELFPDVFKHDGYEDFAGCPPMYKPDGTALLERRGSGDWGGRGLFLNTRYQWDIVRDNEGYQTLTARRK
jgi:hypothetical protein